MGEIDRERVLAASAAWVWVPEGAVELTGESYRLVRFPERLWGRPTAEVTWSGDVTSPAGAIDEVLTRVSGWGIPTVDWWVSDTAPVTERALQERGATVAETVQVLARALHGVPTGQGDAPDVEAMLVDDEPTLRAATAVRTEGWGQPMPDDAQLAADLARTLRDLADGTELRVVARIGRDWVSSGGCEIVDGVARLYGGVTLPGWRGRGAYRAVLGTRMSLARERGADLALVKGRVDTSAPILRRLGFAGFGEERRYELAVPSG